MKGRTVREEVSHPKELHIGTTHIVYQVIFRPRRRRAALQFGEDGQLRIIVPPGYSWDHVQEFVNSNTPWILRHYDKYRDRQPKTFLPGDQFLLGGNLLTLVIRQTSQSRIIVNNDHLIMEIAAQEEFTSQTVREQLILWYRDQAVSQLLPQLDFWAQRMGCYPFRVKVHEYRTRWGYCRQDGLIALNWRIIQAPGSVVDYVLVHELTHLHYPHHQKEFWNALSLILPEYDASKKWLKEQGHLLQW